MLVSINDETVEVADQTTVAALLESLGLPDKGIAVAVNWSVIPRSDWHTPPQTRSAGGSGHGGARWLIPS
jgi:sulfur carrier protein